MACLAPRESHAARACRQGRKRSRAWKEKSPDGSFSRCSRAERMGEELEKVSRPLLAARRRATLRVQGAPGRVSGRRGGGVRHGIGRGRRNPPGMGCGPSAVAGALAGFYVGTSRRGRRRVSESRCHGSNRDSLSRPLAAGMRTELSTAAWLSARNGYGAARHVR